MKEQNKILPISKTLDIDEISYKHFKTDFKYLSLDVCKIIVLSEYADALKKENESLKSSLQPTIEEDKPDFKLLAREYFNRVGKHSSVRIDHHETQAYAKGYQDAWIKYASQPISESKRIKELEEALFDILNALQKEHDNFEPVKRSAFLASKMSAVNKLLLLKF